ncbi:hypothetical protein F3Y22_tig00110482pilonHSYRG00275 [Hibiscus syriacus]|uniref:HAT C-terminal dimerisation domain-containing protein n=1 Tax=Hibiscus syriacus TaxID=106335 RepID=A0A6A3AEJ9_HIBSY|nr:hypothetical protein F3Y22_tig00110482pilonHSYRG00275 [Hibiscus syriacus]
MKTKYIPCTKELRKVSGASNDEDWDKVASLLPFLEIFYETTLSFSRSSYVSGNTFVEEIYDIGYTINRYVDDLNNRLKNTLTSLFDYYASLHPSSTQMRSYSLGPNSSGLHGGEREIRKLKGTNLRKDYVTKVELNDTSETTTELDKYLGDKYVRDNDNFDILDWWLVDALICTQDWIHTSHEPIMIEESLQALENMEEEMKDLTLEQPTIIIDETSKVLEQCNISL